MNLPRVIARALRAQFRQNETRLFLAALLFAVAALTAVQLGAQRTLDLLEAKAAEMNGGDLSITARTPLPDNYVGEAQQRGLRVARVLTFPSMLFAGDAQQLTDIKAVEGAYPVRGQLRVRLANDNAPTTAAVPKAGEAYADARLLQNLGISIGGDIEFGAARLRVVGEIIEDPDGNQLFAMAPRLLVGRDDAERAGLLGPGSRPGYRISLAGDSTAIDSYAAWIEPRLEGGQRLRTVDDAVDSLRGAYQRGRAFIDLATLLCLALSALAMWLALARMAERETDTSALLRCLGANRREVLLLPLGQLMALALPCLPLGIALGALAESAMSQWLAQRFGVEVPAIDVASVLPGLIALIVLLLLCVLPPIFGLLRVAPMRALQASAAQPGRPVRWLLLPLLGLPLAGLLLGGDPTLVLILLGSLLIAAIVSGLLIWLALRALAGIAGRFGGLTRLGFLRLSRKPMLSLLQGAAMTIALTALLAATRIGPGLLGQWRDSLPQDTPNWFLLNIQPDQRDDVLAQLSASGATRIGAMPVAIGRLASVNGTPASDYTPPDPGMVRWRDGPLNLSWSATLPEGNTLVAGDWWPENTADAQLSVERGFAERLGIGVGDRIGLQVGERQIEATIANLRETDWDSFRVNFFIVMNPQAAENIGHGFIASFHLPESSAGAIRELTRSFSNLSPIDVGAILGRIRGMVEEMSRASLALFSLALFAALLVLLGALAYAQGERRREAALLRALGIRKRELSRLMALEWLALGIIAAVVATTLVALIGWLLAREVFDFVYRPGFDLAVIALLAALAVAGAAAWTAARTATRTPPAESLRA